MLDALAIRLFEESRIWTGSLIFNDESACNMIVSVSSLRVILILTIPSKKSFNSAMVSFGTMPGVVVVETIELVKIEVVVERGVVERGVVEEIVIGVVVAVVVVVELLEIEVVVPLEAVVVVVSVRVVLVVGSVEAVVVVAGYTFLKKKNLILI